MERKTEIVTNYFHKDGTDQNYREYYIDPNNPDEDNREFYDQSCQEDLEVLKENLSWPFVPAEASPLTCGVWSKKHGR